MLFTIMSSDRHFNVPLRRTTTTPSLSFLPLSSYGTQSLWEHRYKFTLHQTQSLIRTVTKMCFRYRCFLPLLCPLTYECIAPVTLVFVWIGNCVCGLMHMNGPSSDQYSYLNTRFIHVIPQCLLALCHFEWIYLIHLKCVQVWCFHFSLKTLLWVMLCLGPNSLKMTAWVYSKLAISPTCCLIVDMKCISIAVWCIK